MRANLIFLNTRQAELEQELAAIREAKEAIYAALRAASVSVLHEMRFFGRT